ncbi:hypothetical protein F0562_026825 [Nyssa sinensis]|uniref:Phospholipid scramblase n=1 Tax=Nyssa sinensis TaxID=561372 RepID=A0A5J5BAF6_9ASTE|nr:hypothetical protein F0562_026825 [Nyssa sinensis]
MNWTKGLRFFTNFPKTSRDISKCGAPQNSIANKNQNGILDAEKISFLRRQQERGQVVATSFLQENLGYKDIEIFGRNLLWKFKLLYCFERNVIVPKQHVMTITRRYGQSRQSDPNLDRDFLVQLWVADKRMKRSRRKRKLKIVKHANHDEMVLGVRPSFQLPFRSFFSDASVTEEKSVAERKSDPVKPVLKQPPLSQSTTGFLKPASPEEALVAPLLARSNLLITRDIEWANLVLGFEQENRYAMVDVCYPQSPAGFIREQSNVIARQLLRIRRPFVARITDAMGNELFRVRRPFWWITSSIYAEIDGKEVGVVHQRWHLWKRIYDLYLGNKQFAVVENPGFWNWTFTLKDIDGQVLAQIDRDWRGFGFEIFTDAGQYVIRFGSADSSSIAGPAGVIQDLIVDRPLTLSERAVAVALAVSLDNDYFSRHGGWGIPFVAVGE